MGCSTGPGDVGGRQAGTGHQEEPGGTHPPRGPGSGSKPLIQGRWHSRGRALLVTMEVGGCSQGTRGSGLAPQGQAGRWNTSLPGPSPAPDPGTSNCLRLRLAPPQPHPLTPPNLGPAFQARSHQVAGRSFQIKPFKIRQQQKQVSERWQALQVGAEKSIRGRKGCVCARARRVHGARTRVCVLGGVSAVRTPGPVADAPSGSWSPPGSPPLSPGGRKLSVRVRVHTPHAHPRPRGKPLSPLRSGPQPPPCAAPGRPPSPRPGERRPGGCVRTGKEWERESYGTWINLSARAALSYPAEGFRATGGGGRAEGAGTGEGERQTRTTRH